VSCPCEEDGTVVVSRSGSGRPRMGVSFLSECVTAWLSTFASCGIRSTPPWIKMSYRHCHRKKKAVNTRNRMVWHVKCAPFWRIYFLVFDLLHVPQNFVVVPATNCASKLVSFCCRLLRKFNRDIAPWSVSRFCRLVLKWLPYTVSSMSIAGIKLK